jgi:hypothetical protein
MTTTRRLRPHLTLVALLRGCWRHSIRPRSWRPLARCWPCQPPGWPRYTTSREETPLMHRHEGVVA